MNDCVFCKIISKELPAKVVYENETVLGFENIRPEAPVHLLFVPKRHIEWTGDFSEETEKVLSHLIISAKNVAHEKKIDQAYKLIFNVGKTGHILHLHLHLLGGWRKKVPLHNI